MLSLFENVHDVCVEIHWDMDIDGDSVALGNLKYHWKLTDANSIM